MLYENALWGNLPEETLAFFDCVAEDRWHEILATGAAAYTVTDLTEKALAAVGTGEVTSLAALDAG